MAGTSGMLRASDGVYKSISTIFFNDNFSSRNLYFVSRAKWKKKSIEINVIKEFIEEIFFIFAKC
jgi:hypothetical protein